MKKPSPPLEQIVVSARDTVVITDAQIALERPSGKPTWNYAPIITVHGRRFQVATLHDVQKGTDLDTLEEVELNLSKVRW